MSCAARGARCMFEYLKGNAVYAYGMIILWISEHPRQAELIKALIEAVLIEVASKLIGKFILKKVIKI